MTSSPASASILALAACFVLLSALAVMRNVQAQDAALPGLAPPKLIHFDIPAQPLPEALKAYGRLTEFSVMAESRTLTRHTSTAVHGDFTAREALQRMLADTGLETRFPSANAASIFPSATASHDAAVAPAAAIPASAIDGVMAGGVNYLSYVGLVQRRLIQMLCRSPQTRPGAYRLVVQLRIGNSGNVAASQVVGSTGDAVRDGAIARALRVLSLDVPPPSMPQPVTLLLRPDGGGVTTDCRATAARED